MYRTSLAILVSALWAYAQECNSEAMEKKMPCYQRFVDYPTFSSGERYKEELWVCFHQWHTVQSYKDTTVQGLPVSLNAWYRPCKEITGVEYKPAYPGDYKYVAYYGMETLYEIMPNKGTYLLIRETQDTYYENSVIELFRADGSLRYRGKVMLDRMQLSTSGDCYDKTGSKPTRHTNNANTCK